MIELAEIPFFAGTRELCVSVSFIVLAPLHEQPFGGGAGSAA